jgi:hypothetical protein
VLLLAFVNKMDIKAKDKTSKECILTRFLAWCNSSLPFAFASSKYFARRRRGSPASSITENETTGFNSRPLSPNRKTGIEYTGFHGGLYPIILPRS